MIYAENILICIAAPLFIIQFFVGRSTRRFIVSFLLGMLICLLAAYIGGFANLISGIGAEDTAIFISPVIEESMKLLPLLLFLFLYEPDNNGPIRTAAGIGAGFATFENCCYILTAGADRLMYILIRGLAVGVMHIVSILALVLGLIMARGFRALSIASVMGALAMSMTFHGLYNLLVSVPGTPAGIGYILPIVTAFIIYIPFRRFQDKAEE